jgi:hypothetical protein
MMRKKNQLAEQIKTDSGLKAERNEVRVSQTYPSARRISVISTASRP